jgi:hypothetical protein
MYEGKTCFGMLVVYFRVACIMLNEIVMYAIVICANIGEDRGIGMIVNFSAAIIICELDDLLMSTGRIQRIKDYYENLPNQTSEIVPDKDSDYYRLGDRKYSECGFLKVFVPKGEKVGENACMCLDWGRCRKVTRCISSNCSWLSHFSIGPNSGTTHRIYLLCMLGYLFWSDFYRFDVTDFNKAAIAEGGFLTASSSWLPNYPLEYA